MRILILHKKTKREINGPFQMCVLNPEHLKQMRDVIQKEIDAGFQGGWINFDEIQPASADRVFDIKLSQPSIANHPPIPFD